MELTRKQITEFKRVFKYMSFDAIKVTARNYKTLNGLLKRLASDNKQAEKEFNAPLPVFIEIELNWNRSRLYGLCPRADLRYKDAAGNYFYIPGAGYAGGCGYDKESAAVAECLNRFKSLLYSIRRKDFKRAPYGISKGINAPYFCGGVGVNCYRNVFRWLGYTFEHVASGKTYDKYIITKNGARRAAL